MKNLKKIALIFAMTICLAVCFFAVEASAATYGDLTYTVSSGAVTITDCNESASGSLTIPSKIDGCPVTGIGDYAFYECSKLTSVTIPKSVTSIGDCAFEYCSGLTSIKIPDGVKNIGYGAFEECSSLKTVTIPGSVTSIGDSAFYECDSLKSITIPDSVTSIGYCAFEECSSLESIKIGNSVKSIDNYTFDECDSLKSITIPDSVTSIGYGAFEYCSSLESIKIGNSVTSIGDSAFYDCSKLISVTIPKSVTSIGDCAFGYCSGLTSIIIPDSVTSIGNSAFYECDSLKSIIIPDSVKSIGAWAFSYCSDLASIKIGNSVTSIGNDAFYSCSKLKTVYYCGTKSQFSKIKIGTQNTWFTVATVKYHNYKTITSTRATLSKNGSVVKKCSFCSAKTTTVIYMPKTFTLSKTSYTCTGSAIKPTVTVKDSKGNKIAASNYTVTYSNNTNPGTAKAKITFKGNYSGTKTLTYKITLGKVKVTSAAMKSGTYKVSVKWSKVAGAKSYEIYYYNNTDKKYEELLTTAGTSYSKTWSGWKTVKLKIRAVCGSTKGAWSDVVTLKHKA